MHRNLGDSFAHFNISRLRTSAFLFRVFVFVSGVFWYRWVQFWHNNNISISYPVRLHNVYSWQRVSLTVTSVQCTHCKHCTWQFNVASFVFLYPHKQRIQFEFTFFYIHIRISRSTETVRILSICVDIAYIQSTLFCFVLFRVRYFVFRIFPFVCILYQIQYLLYCTNYINSKNNTSCKIPMDNIPTRYRFKMLSILSL